MRIGIFGSYNYTSIGDHAILEGILTQFRRRTDDLSVVIFSFDPASTEGMLISHEGATITNAAPRLAARVAQGKMESRGCQRRSKIRAFRQKVKHMLTRWPRAMSPILQVYRGYRLLRSDLALLKPASFWRQKVREIKKLDILIIGGGNLLMDLYSSWPIYPLIYVVMAKLARVPTMFYAVGAGPIRSRRARWYLRLAGYLANAMTLRDQESLNTVRKRLKIKASKLSLSADPAVCLDLQGEKVPNEGSSSLIFGMTVVPFYSPRYWPDPNVDVYGKYTNYMANIVKSITEQFAAKVIFFATNHPNDFIAALDVLQKISCRDRIKIIEDRLSVSELISLIASCDVLIGTRLHSLILSLVAGTPFLAFSYQPKVEAFCKRIGFERYVIPLSNQLDISERQILTLLQELTERDAIQAYAKKELRQLQQAAELSCEIAIDLANRGA